MTGSVPSPAPAARARFVVSLPQAPCVLAAALNEVAPEGAPVLTATTEAFRHLATRAKSRLVLLTPFIDEAGANWAIDVFSHTTAPRRLLVLRDKRRLADFPVLAARLRDLGVTIKEYRVHHPIGIRRKPIETFHAKIVMADGSVAYVGSANLLESSFEVALECGFIIEGAAVAQVVDLVEAVLRVAT